jgi:hypothetical protein
MTGSTIDSKTHRFPSGSDKIALDPDGFTTIAEIALFIGGGGGGGAPVWITATPPNAASGSAYSYTFVATGSPTPTYAITSGVLPTGLTFNGTTGVLSGTPTLVGSFSFTVTASNGVSPDAVTVEMVVVVASSGWTPAALPSLVAWWDASNAGSITASAGLVSQWNDLSGAANHLTASGARRPTTGVDTVNSLNAMKFSGAQSMASALSSMGVSAERSWLAVIKMPSLTGSQTVVGASSAGGTAWNCSGGLQNLNAMDVAAIGASSTNVGSGAAVQIGVLRHNTTTWAFRLNGVADGSGTSGANTFGFTVLVGSETLVNVDPFFFTGDICELIGCDVVLGSTDLANAEAYLKAKWATP